MAFKVVLTQLFCIVTFTLVTMATDDVSKNFVSENIEPEFIDVAPSAKLNVVYPGNKEVLFNELTPADVKTQPNVSWNANPDKLYTLSMVDPDVPSRAAQTLREMNHWLVVNIKGQDLTTGQTLMSYAGSRPPKGSGLHRYIFLVYQQRDPISITEDSEDFPRQRKNFSIRKFAEKYNLEDPIAGNFYRAQWDSSVPERRH